MAKNFDPNIGKNTQFKKGQSGNPKGRAKGKSISTYLKEFLDCEIDYLNPITKEKGKLPLSAIAALKQIKNAIIDGDRLAINDIMDRLEGKPLQRQENKTEITAIEIIDANQESTEEDEQEENTSN